MWIVNNKGTFYRPYTQLGPTKIVYYETDPKRLPHQGEQEMERRRRQKYNRLKDASFREQLRARP